MIFGSGGFFVAMRVSPLLRLTLHGRREPVNFIGNEFRAFGAAFGEGERRMGITMKFRHALLGAAAIALAFRRRAGEGRCDSEGRRRPRT